MILCFIGVIIKRYEKILQVIRHFDHAQFLRDRWSKLGSFLVVFRPTSGSRFGLKTVWKLKTL